MDDVLVVGGRCAGASTALRLARAGLRVRLVERARHLGDVVSGHLVKPLGVRLLHDWGVLDALEEAGTPPLGDRGPWLGGRPQPTPPPPPGGRPPRPGGPGSWGGRAAHGPPPPPPGGGARR